MKLDVLAIGAHPDDVELGCGGTLALLSASGKRTGILHLTRGEAGTRGSAEQRVEEARRAAGALGVEVVDFLDCGDGSLRTGVAEEEALIDALRRYRPDLILCPPPRDRHPDHGRSNKLVEAASFYSGLAGRKTGDGQSEPHRPAAVFHYMQHDAFEPRFIVDVTPTWKAKVESLAAYESQLHQGVDDDGDEPMTKIASREFRAAVEGRARHFGMLIGAEFGEPFGSRQPVAVSDLWQLVPGGLR